MGPLSVVVGDRSARRAAGRRRLRLERRAEVHVEDVRELRETEEDVRELLLAFGVAAGEPASPEEFDHVREIIELGGKTGHLVVRVAGEVLMVFPLQKATEREPMESKRVHKGGNPGARE